MSEMLRVMSLISEPAELTLIHVMSLVQELREERGETKDESHDFFVNLLLDPESHMSSASDRAFKLILCTCTERCNARVDKPWLWNMPR